MTVSLRAGVPLAAGSLVVHELRYVLAPGDEAAGAAGAHGYLAWAAPAVALLLALGFGVWLSRLGRDRHPTRTLTWAAASAALASTYGVQESLEALASPGHPGLTGQGGWLVPPIVLAVGGLVTLLVRGSAFADRAAAAAARPWSPVASVPAAPRAVALPRTPFVHPRRRAIVLPLAGRAPPFIT